MPTERVILCGSVSSADLPVRDPQPLRLARWGADANIHLMYEDVRLQLGQAPPQVWEDLLDIATFVYCADQAVTRGGDGVLDVGQAWRRQLYFRIAVRCPERWNSPGVQRMLTNALSFLSEDEYHFEFEPLGERPADDYFHFSRTPFDGLVDEVSLFSGGIDSFAGVVQAAKVDHRKVVLIHHRSNEKLTPRIHTLVSRLQEVTGQAPPLFMPVRINKDEKLSREFTQRTRSFLYAALGATVAFMLKLDRIRFYENGVVSLNLPPAGQVVGARASRTTHPRALALFSQLLTNLAERPFVVENPFLGLTKTEVIRHAAEAGCGDLLPWTISCVHTIEITNDRPHCGICSQCVDRRLAMVAAGQESTATADGYRCNIFVDEVPEGYARTFLTSYLESAQAFETLNQGAFFARFGEASRVLRHIPGNPEEVAGLVHDLHRRHGLNVASAIKTALVYHTERLRQRDLPPYCLLRLVCDPLVEPPDEPTPPTIPAITVIQPGSANGFQRSGKAWLAWFQGSKAFVVLPSRGATYLHHLLSRPYTPISVVDLALPGDGNARSIGSAGEAGDREMLLAYELKIEELREELSEANGNRDVGRQEQIAQELELLLQQVRGIEGFGTRLRRVADDRERMRKAVSKAIHHTLREIAESSPSLNAHLHSRLRRGLTLMYDPEPGIAWEV
jgi:hypothetical protein